MTREIVSIRAARMGRLAAAAVLAVACSGDLGTAPRERPAPATRTVFPGGFETDFGAETAGTPPSGWSGAWVPSTVWTVKDEPGATGGKVLAWSSVDVSRNRYALAYDGYGVLQNQAVYTEFTVAARDPGAPVAYLGAAAVRLGGTSADPHGYALYFVDNQATGTRNVVLATFENNVYLQLQDIPLAWNLDEWYSIRLEAIGAQIHARVWPRGTAEPVGWPIDVYDERYPSGRPGVANHDLGTVYWDVWAVDPAPPPPPPPVGSTWVETFTTGAPGGAPAGWTATSAPADVAWSVEADPAAVDGQLLRAASAATARHILRLDAIPDTTVHQEAFIRFRMGDGDDRGPGLALRHTMSGGAESAYVAYLRTGAGEIEIDRFDAGAWSFMASKPFASTPGVWYRMRFGALGSGLRVKVWPEGTPEPGGWTLQSNDAALPNGSVGIYVYEPNTVDVDGFSAASGGLAAPTPPVRTLVTPDSAQVVASGTVQLAAYARTLAGDSVGAAVSWSAPAGSVSPAGVFTAPYALGAVQVTATPGDGSPAGTATVVVTAPPPPAAPGGLTAVPASGTSVALAWADQAAGEDGYTVEAAPDAAGAPGTWATVATLPPDATAYTSTGLTQGSTYWFRVSAFNLGGPAASNAASATPPLLPAAATGVGATALSTSSIRLEWTDAATNEDGYQVERAPDVNGVAGTYAQVGTAAAGATQFTDGSLLPGTRYWYRVRAYNVAGTSASSAAASATTQFIMPQALTATGARVNGLGIATLSWQPGSAAQVDVVRGGVVVRTSIDNTGGYVDALGPVQVGSKATYRICVAGKYSTKFGTAWCSNSVTVVF
ncbi:MAG TPA: fibronectin type III domain-containing protein [Longimicrobium sp.]|nr:fibronectin type III domain-containing protein [Longimicrobium sp.]